MSVSKIEKEPNTYEVSGSLTDDDVKFINTLPNGSIVRMKYTNQATPARLSKVISNVKFSVYGSVNYVDKQKYQKDFEKHVRTEYYPRELAVITNRLNKMTREEVIDPNWSDLKKAMYCAISLAREIEYEHLEGNWEKKIPGTNNEKGNFAQSLRCVYDDKGVCAGYAMAYAEMLHNLGLKCEYQEKIGKHAWNVITINGKRIPVDITWFAAALRNETINSIPNPDTRARAILQNFGGVKPSDFYSNPSHDVVGDPEENTDFRTMDYFNLSDPVVLNDLKTIYNEVHQATNSKTFKMMPNATNPALLIAEYPEIATGGAYKAYMVSYNGPDIVKNGRKLATGDLVLTYAPSDITLTTYDPQKIIDAILSGELKGFIGREKHEALYQDYISRAEPQSINFRRSMGGSVAVYKNQGSVVNGVHAYAGLRVDNSVPNNPVLKYSKFYSERDFMQAPENLRNSIGDNVLNETRFAAAQANGGYIGNFQDAGGGTAIWGSDANYESKVQSSSMLP